MSLLLRQKTSPRRATKGACWFFACVMMAFLPFGCGGAIEYPPLKQVSFIEARHAPNKTIARLRECVEEYGGRLRGGGFEFNYTVDVDEWGGAASVKSDVFHADFDGCTRAALRAIQFDPEVLLTWISDPFAQGEGQTNAARALVGNLVVAGVRIVLAPILIEAAGVTIVLVVAIVITEEVIEAIKRRRPPNLNRCLDAAAGGPYMWEEFCRSIGEGYRGSPCWGEAEESEQHKRGWCNEKFGTW